ncbi:hypothetical protein [Bifidobacterium pseudolongum]|uniref:hypothetical protein n=1 Tax=Bifidobacterium pseudolongum TaxID=1694 RepID=UPI001EE677DA|nr:hypothetical protein [Bifidobacterium pseudolongum]UNP90934.1 hypothetical protein MPY69_05635 [Bifidobacterium pseudolongum subsp. pseudolongum]WCA41356.1 hypothetical protein PGB23_02805 [Bifidobacterium pseudolongum subsp. pseudolongum]
MDGTLHWWAALIGLALATMLICEIGVFTPVAVLIVAPLAIEMGSKLHISKLALLTALSGGGKAGNIISPNPNAIAAASGFHVDLAESDLPSLWSALVAPVTAVVLLMLGPIGSVTHIAWLEHLQIDALYILPFAVIVGMLAMRKGRYVLEYTKSGMGRMVDVVMIVIAPAAAAITMQAGATVIDGLPQGNYFHVHRQGDEHDDRRTHESRAIRSGGRPDHDDHGHIAHHRVASGWRRHHTKTDTHRKETS